MSWSIVLIGTPDGIAKELDAHAQTLDDQSKQEFLEARPHLQGVVRLAVGQMVKLNASGHATITNGEKKFGQISVSLDTFYGKYCQ